MKNLSSFLNFAPNTDQQAALGEIQKFLSDENDNEVFILDGSAGTGKTTIVKAVVDALLDSNGKLFLAAPTGRAAKILGKKSGFGARTVHSLIYDPESLENGGVKFKRKENKISQKSVFIIDESSVLSDELSRDEFYLSFSSLLSDLFAYVRAGNKKNKIIFIGDRCQLPPVSKTGNNFSPALSADYLMEKYNCKVTGATLRQVMRQEGNSQILEIATSLRDSIQNGSESLVELPQLRKSWEGYGYFQRVFDRERLDKVCVIACCNKDVNHWNNRLRQEIFNPTGELVIGEHVILQSNWMTERNFLMKGEGARISKVSERDEVYAGLHFRNIVLTIDSPFGEPRQYQAKCLMDVLSSHNGTLHSQQEKVLRAESIRKNKKFRESKLPQDDPYVGAIRLRYGYALTCHKAQGGEWDEVLIHPFLPSGNAERWLYTAVTRAKSKVLSWPGYKAA